MNKTLTYRDLIVLLFTLSLMFSCTQPSSQNDADDVTPRMIETLNLLTTRLIEVKEEMVLDEIGKVLADFDVRTSFGVATFPEGIPNPGEPTLVTFESVQKGGIETVSFPEEHRELATSLYAVLKTHDVQENIAFTDLREVNIEEVPRVEFKRGLEGLKFDTRAELCAAPSSSEKKTTRCYCRSWYIPDTGCVCTLWDEST